MSTLCLVTLACFDLITTLLLLKMGMQEANPLFSPLLRVGVWAFILGKIAFVVGPILIIEWARKKHPTTAEQATWIAFGAYLILYVRHIATLF